MQLNGVKKNGAPIIVIKTELTVMTQVRLLVKQPARHILPFRDI